MAAALLVSLSLPPLVNWPSRFAFCLIFTGVFTCPCTMGTGAIISLTRLLKILCLPHPLLRPSLSMVELQSTIKCMLSQRFVLSSSTFTDLLGCCWHLCWYPGTCYWPHQPWFSQCMWGLPLLEVVWLCFSLRSWATSPTLSSMRLIRCLIWVSKKTWLRWVFGCLKNAMLWRGSSKHC